MLSVSIVLCQPCMCVCVSADELSKYLYYVRRLDFFETPDYDYLRQLFTSVLTNSGCECDWDFDWIDRQLVSFNFLLITSLTVINTML